MKLLDLFRKTRPAEPATPSTAPATKSRAILTKAKEALSSQTIRWALYLIARLWLKDKNVLPADVDAVLVAALPFVDWLLSGLDVLAGFKVIGGRLQARTVFRSDGPPVNASAAVEAAGILDEIAKLPEFQGSPFSLALAEDTFAGTPQATRPGDVLRRITAQAPMARPRQAVDVLEAPDAEPAPQLEPEPVAIDPAAPAGLAQADLDAIALANPADVVGKLREARDLVAAGVSPAAVVQLLTPKPEPVKAPAKVATTTPKRTRK